MSGLLDYGFSLFNSEAVKLRALGYTVINPAETDSGSTDKSWHYYMKKDIALMVGCDALVVLPNWKDSKGAKIEVTLARELSIPVLDTNLVGIDFDKPSETICQEADQLVSHDRQDSYGHPFHDFTRQGRIWGAILSDWAATTSGNSPIPPELVGLCMVGLKISREVNKPKYDNRCDGIGYWKCIDMVQQAKQTSH